jgi:hypothetical protein
MEILFWSEGAGDCEGTERERRENGTKIVCYCKAESDAKNIETYGDLLCKMLRSGGAYRGVPGAQEHFEVVVEGRGS